ncbi:MAG TPA: lamin tail domain-containing protein [bacterium]|nr:lamin tail domain-containing protein [bacterium]
MWRRGIVIFIGLGFLLWPNLLLPLKIANAYDVGVTHQRLTTWTAEQSARAIATEEKAWLIAGAAAEDQPISRTLHHFWSPQTDQPLNRGLYATMNLATAPDWGQTGDRQASWLYQGKFSWNQAIEFYRQGNLEKAFTNLGHVLHLLQDMSVPAHVRNDPHELGDSYENWLWQNRDQLSSYPGMVYPRCLDYRDCFRQLALAVSQHYFSQDTISYSLRPATSGYINYRGYKLVYYQANRQRFFLDDQVHADYWQQLSPLAIGYGAELLRLFFLSVDGLPATTKASATVLAKTITTKATTTPAARATTTRATTTTKATTVTIATTSKATATKATIATTAKATTNKTKTATTTKATTTKATTTKATTTKATTTKASASVASTSYTVASTRANISSDSQPPETYIKSGPPSAVNTGTANFLFSANKIATYECQLNDKNWRKCDSDYQIKNLVSGEYQLQVRAIDQAGSIDQSPATWSWLIDKTRPKISWLSKPSSTVSERSADFSLSVNESANFFCQLDDSQEKACSEDFSYGDLALGQHQIIVRAQDTAGNYSAKLTHKWKIVSPNTTTGTTATSTATTTPTSSQAVIDKIAPSSTVDTLPETVEELGFTVSWQGSDNSSTPAELLFDIDYRLGSGSWDNWLSEVNYRQAVFSLPAQPGQKISFRSRAYDTAGNREYWPTDSGADAWTVLLEKEPEPSLKVVISQLATRGPAGASDEFVELYNPNNKAVDLSAWRLQTRSASGNTWINRSGSNGLPDGSQIEAHGYFLLASKDYSRELIPDYQHEGNWGLSDDGGHWRVVDNLGVELDRIGYNQSVEPEGEAAIADLAQGYSLQRKAVVTSTANDLIEGGNHFSLGNGFDSDNNAHDFIEQTNVWSRSGTGQIYNQERFSPDLKHLWHFDECFGRNTKDSIGSADFINHPFTWVGGQYDCAVYQTWEQPKAEAVLDNINPDYVTFSYWWRNDSYPNDGRGHEYLITADGQIALGLTLSIYNSQLWNNGNYYVMENVMPLDNSWHLVTLTKNRGDLKFFVDGQLKFSQTVDYRPMTSIIKLELADENYPMGRDEIALWQRALNEAEVKQLFYLSQPLEPLTAREEQAPAVAKYLWSFDQPISSLNLDNLQQVALEPLNNRIYSPFEYGVRIEHPNDPQASLLEELNNQDVSLSLWWKNSDYSQEDRINLWLSGNNGGDLFGLTLGSYGLKVHYNGQAWYPLTMTIEDNEWHQTALVYDSYRYQLTLYFDGQPLWRESRPWLVESLSKLIIAQDAQPIDLDELTLWQGALTDEQIETIYELAKEEL